MEPRDRKKRHDSQGQLDVAHRLERRADRRRDLLVCRRSQDSRPLLGSCRAGPPVVQVVRSLLGREPGVDVIALLALAGSLAPAEYLAGAVIAVMLTGGRVLERSATGGAPRS